MSEQSKDIEAIRRIANMDVATRARLVIGLEAIRRVNAALDKRVADMLAEINGDQNARGASGDSGSVDRTDGESGNAD